MIRAEAEIGNDEIVLNGVSVGSIFPGQPDIRQPKTGNNVFIGTGAKVLGGMKIGDTAKIGANAVVLESFGPGVNLAGVPARIVENYSDVSGGNCPTC